MIKFNLNNNSVLNYIPLEAIKPVFGFFPTEESANKQYRDHNYDGVNNINNTQSIDAFIDIDAHYNTPFATSKTYSNYMGSANMFIPHIIDASKADFKTFYLSEGLDLSSYNNPSNIESWLSELFDSNDNFKIATLFNGLQLLKLPINCYHDLSTNPVEPKYGLHYIKVSPKYVDVLVNDIIMREQKNWIDYSSFDLNLKNRQTILLNKADLLNTAWAFENNSSIYQRGRLIGSIAEIWDSTKQTKKQTKIIVESDYYNDNDALNSSIVLSPDTIGYDAPTQVITPGDIIRIYPRESYFLPIFVEVNYQSLTNDLTSLIRFMKNDAARDLTNNIYEIYDDNGITIDSNGNVDGQVVMSYQIVKVGQKEIRKQIIS